MLSAFLPRPDEARIRAACIGVAGPVLNGCARTTNLLWALDERELAKALSAERVRLLNDVEAAAYGMLYLRDDELCILNPGKEPRGGHACLLAAGTGLGQALLFWDGGRYHPMASSWKPSGEGAVCRAAQGGAGQRGIESPGAPDRRGPIRPATLTT